MKEKSASSRVHSKKGQHANQVPAERGSAYEELRNKVLGPLNQRLIVRIRRLSWAKAVLVLVATIAITALASWVWERPAEVKEVFQLLGYYWDARHASIRWREDDSSKPTLKYVEDEFAPSRRGTLDGRHDAWTEAQMRVALDGLHTIEDSEISHWFDSQMSSCSCWRQHLDSPVDHIGATAWVLLAFSRLKHMPSKSQITFILDNQHATGWWPQYPSQDNEENASTYATALSVWALHELSERSLISEDHRQNVVAAIRAGTDWLVTHHVKDRPASWKDYQRGEYGRESVGLSGLVAHVLHVVDSSLSPSIDEDWMAHLPAELPSVGDQVSSGQPVALGSGGFFSDATHNFTLPWVVTATVDAYPKGSIRQRAQALKLIYMINKRRDEIRQGIQDSPWLAAEVLMSLRYLEGYKVI